MGRAVMAKYPFHIKTFLCMSNLSTCVFRKPSIFVMGNYIIPCRYGLSIRASSASWFVNVMEGRELRSMKNMNYRELADLQLPRAHRKHHLDTSNEVFPVHYPRKG